MAKPEYHGGAPTGHTSEADCALSRKGWQYWYPHEPKYAMADLYDTWVTAGECDYGFGEMIKTLKSKPLLCMYAAQIMEEKHLIRAVKAMQPKPRFVGGSMTQFASKDDEAKFEHSLRKCRLIERIRKAADGRAVSRAATHGQHIASGLSSPSDTNEDKAR